MKNSSQLNFSKFFCLSIAFILAGCGGGSSSNSETENVTPNLIENSDTSRPTFLARDVTISPSATPTGDIAETSPSFTWNAIPNATEYHYGHEDIGPDSNQDTWISYKFLPEELNCAAEDSICSHTPSNYVFTVGEQRAWWVRGRVNGIWSEWSDPRVFTIIENATIGVPSTIAPTGNIVDTAPEFSWTSVAGISEYQIGHEDRDTSEWQKYTVTKEQAGCIAIDQVCTFTPSNQLFEAGEKFKWWVRAGVNDNWGEWSTASKFAIIEDTPVTLIPEQLTPSGEISSPNPIFSWTMVEGATEYLLGHEETDTTTNWQQFSITPAQATCLNAGANCTYSLPENTFTTGINMGWWVRAVVNGTPQVWSEGKGFVITNPEPIANLRINEVLASNTHSELDPDFFDFSDWIELYNPTSQDINLSNYGLSDDEDPLQWKFPVGTIIPSNSYLMVWADDEIGSNALHANFKLSSKGEKLTLADASGIIIDSIDFDEQISDVTTAKLNDSIVYMTPTPGAQNGTAYPSQGLSKAPQFTFESGFFNAPISLALSQENGAEIFYTLDGSTPNINSLKYTQAINITEATVIRAISNEVGNLPSEIISNSYFINHTSNLPVLSITIDPEYLFNQKTGIYTDGDGTNGVPLNQCNSAFTEPFNYAQEWERTSHLEFFGAERNSEFSLTSGISISGQCSRSNQKKSFSFELDSKFGTKTLKYKLFESKEIDKFKDFKLRTGASGYELSDLLAASLINTANLNVDYQASRTSQVFVNGEYWGIYNFREKKGADFITSNYPDIDKDELDIINQGYTAKNGDTDDYNALVLLLETLNLDLSIDADYQQIISKIDESNYIDYMSLMIYSANFDWISSNQRSWKEKKEGAKWRWMADDVDSGFQAEATELDLFTALVEADFPDAMVHLFRGLTKNATFNQKFKTRFTELLNTTFSPSNMLNRINVIVDERDDYIPLENAKWSSINIEKFDRYVQGLRDFANSRSAIVKDQLDIFIP